MPESAISELADSRCRLPDRRTDSSASSTTSAIAARPWALGRSRTGAEFPAKAVRSMLVCRMSTAIPEPSVKTREAGRHRACTQRHHYTEMLRRRQPFQARGTQKITACCHPRGKVFRSSRFYGPPQVANLRLRTRALRLHVRICESVSTRRCRLPPLHLLISRRAACGARTAGFPLRETGRVPQVCRSAPGRECHSSCRPERSP